MAVINKQVKREMEEGDLIAYTLLLEYFLKEFDCVALKPPRQTSSSS